MGEIYQIVFLGLLYNVLVHVDWYCWQIKCIKDQMHR